MASSNPPTVEPGTPAASVRRLFRATGARLVVVTSRGKFEGVIYRSSILRLTSTKTEARARDLMEEPPFTLEPQTTLGDALRTMLKYDEWYGVIVDGGVYKGVLGLENVIEAVLDDEEMASLLEKEKVEDHMTREVVTASPDDFVSSIWRMMTEYRYAGIPVVDERGRLVGIITQYDLIRRGYSRIELESEAGARRGARVREAMTTGVIFVYPWTTLRDAARIMVERGVGRLPVVESPNSKRLVGIVDREDVVRFILG